MTAGTCATRPPISPSASTWKASSTCWASGCRRTRARRSGRPSAPSSPTATCRGRTDRLLRRPDRLPRSSRRQAWPEATAQTCVVHLTRAAMRFVSHPRPQGRHHRAEADLSGRERRDSACRARRLRGDRAGQGATPRPARHSVTRGERFTPFLAFPPELRRVIYTTNSIESLNHQLRKITQEPRPLPKRSRGRQAALAGDLRHRRQTSARPGERARSAHRATQSTRTPRRGPGHDELETSTATTLTGLPRPHQPPPLTTMTANAYTKNLTGSGVRSTIPVSSFGPRPPASTARVET